MWSWSTNGGWLVSSSGDRINMQYIESIESKHCHGHTNDEDYYQVIAITRSGREIILADSFKDLKSAQKAISDLFDKISTKAF